MLRRFQQSGPVRSRRLFGRKFLAIDGVLPETYCELSRSAYRHGSPSLVLMRHSVDDLLGDAGAQFQRLWIAWTIARVLRRAIRGPRVSLKSSYRGALAAAAFCARFAVVQGPGANPGLVRRCPSRVDRGRFDRRRVEGAPCANRQASRRQIGDRARP